MERSFPYIQLRSALIHANKKGSKKDKKGKNENRGSDLRLFEFFVLFVFFVSISTFIMRPDNGSNCRLNVLRQQLQQHMFDLAADRFVRVADPRYVGRRVERRVQRAPAPVGDDHARFFGD
jgi:hypothetical protein